MKNICLCFQIHQPYRLKRYRFFDIGNDHYYYDDFLNEDVFRSITDKSYRPALSSLGDMLADYPDFRFALSVSGLALEQMEYYSPDLIDKLRTLVRTGRVEILGETYSHSLSSLYDMDEWRAEVRLHTEKVEQLFGIRPTVLCNTELIYSDDIAIVASQMGYAAMLTEGAKHILGWRNTGYVYQSATAPELKILMRNAGLSDAIAMNFARYNHPDYPLTADKFVRWIAESPTEEEQYHYVVLNMDVLGAVHNKATGIFAFLQALPRMAQAVGVGFAMPAQHTQLRPVAEISVVFPISHLGEEKDVSAWMGNRLQQSVRDKLIEWGERVRLSEDRRTIQDWLYLQSSDHFFYMNTKRGGAGGFSPYDGPYDAFNNYMNVLSDLLLRVETLYPSSIENEELRALLLTIRNQDKAIQDLESELHKVKEELSLRECRGANRPR